MITSKKEILTWKEKCERNKAIFMNENLISLTFAKEIEIKQNKYKYLLLIKRKERNKEFIILSNSSSIIN
jgi:hypothetical protein